MTAAAAPARTCGLCGATCQGAEPCPECGMTAEFGPEAVDPFDRRALALLLGSIVAVFAVTLLVVALTA